MTPFSSSNVQLRHHIIKTFNWNSKLMMGLIPQSFAILYYSAIYLLKSLEIYQLDFSIFHMLFVGRWEVHKIIWNYKMARRVCLVCTPCTIRRVLFLHRVLFLQHCFHVKEHATGDYNLHHYQHLKEHPPGFSILYS